MAKTKGRTETVERVMREFKHGELKSRDGRTIKDRRQAVAVALSEAGDSNQVTLKQNRHNLAHTKANEGTGKTSQQQKEGKRSIASNRSELYAEAKRRDIAGRSKMNKAQLERALSS